MKETTENKEDSKRDCWRTERENNNGAWKQDESMENYEGNQKYLMN